MSLGTEGFPDQDGLPIPHFEPYGRVDRTWGVHTIKLTNFLARSLTEILWWPAVSVDQWSKPRSFLLSINPRGNLSVFLTNPYSMLMYNDKSEKCNNLPEYLSCLIKQSHKPKYGSTSLGFAPALTTTSLTTCSHQGTADYVLLPNAKETTSRFQFALPEIQGVWRAVAHRPTEVLAVKGLH